LTVLSELAAKELAASVQAVNVPVAKELAVKDPAAVAIEAVNAVLDLVETVIDVADLVEEETKLPLKIWPNPY
jgi:predicted ABC-type ATPase